MFRYFPVLGAAIVSLPVHAQVEKEIGCALASGLDKVMEMTIHLNDVSTSTMKSDEICRVAQDTLREAISIKNAALANKSCPPDATFRKSADLLITESKQVIDEQKCR